MSFLSLLVWFAIFWLLTVFARSFSFSFHECVFTGRTKFLFYCTVQTFKTKKTSPPPSYHEYGDSFLRFMCVFKHISKVTTLPFPISHQIELKKRREKNRILLLLFRLYVCGCARAWFFDVLLLNQKQNRKPKCDNG